MSLLHPFPHRPFSRGRLVLVGSLTAFLALLAAPAWAWWSDSAGLAAVTVTAGVLRPPTDIACVDQSQQEPQISWTAPATNRNTYLVTITGDGVSGSPPTAEVTGTSWTVDPSLLEDAGTYTVTIATTWSDWTAPATQTVQLTLATAPGLASCA